MPTEGNGKKNEIECRPELEHTSNLSELTFDEVLSLNEEELEKLIVKAQRPDSHLSCAEIEEQLRGLKYIPGFGSIFLGVDEKIVGVIKKEASHYRELDRIAKEAGFEQKIDYEWLIDEINKISQAVGVSGEAVLLESGLRAVCDMAISTISCPFPVMEFADYIFYHPEQPWRNIKLSLYTAQLIKYIRFPEGIAAEDYRLSVARFIWVMGIGPKELQEKALEIDWNNSIEYLRELTEKLNNAYKIETSESPRYLLELELRRAGEVNMLIEYMIRGFPMDENFSSQMKTKLEEIKGLLGNLPEPSFGDKKALWPAWAKELDTIFRYIIGWILEEREDLREFFGEFVERAEGINF